MLKTIAIDDEPIALEVIKNHSEKIPFIRLDGCFTNAFEAMDYMVRVKPDLLFLDIKMPDISGIDLLRSLPDPPMVIFTTAYSEHAVQSFELDAIDYLLKPFSLPRFLKACNKAREQFELRSNKPPVAGEDIYVFIKSGYGQIRVALEELLYVESNGNYMQFVLRDRKIISRLTMSETEALLPRGSFLRIHRSYIVSGRHVGKIEKKSVWVGQTELPVGAGYTQEIEKLIKKS
jgi:DNA-binding LytR/AlgR family response regulator